MKALPSKSLTRRMHPPAGAWDVSKGRGGVWASVPQGKQATTRALDEGVSVVGRHRVRVKARWGQWGRKQGWNYALGGLQKIHKKHTHVR